MSSVQRATRCRVLVTITVGAMLCAGAGLSVGASPSALPDEGVLHLKLGASDQFEWIRNDPATDVIQKIVDKRTVTTLVKDACILYLDPPASSNPSPGTGLATLIAGTGTNQPGLNSDSIGVFSGGNGSNARGVDCSRVSGTETLTLTLAGLLPPPYAVRYADIDIEVKQNAWIRLTTSLIGSTDQPRFFELRSGSSINLAVPTGTKLADGTVVTNCTASSDSGPDSGPNDNCRWIIDAVWNSATFTTKAGSWSLEGGADWPTPPSNEGAWPPPPPGTPPSDTKLWLTQSSGVLNCLQTTIQANGPNGANAVGLRLKNLPNAANSTECTPIPYVLVWRNESNKLLLEFIKDDLDQNVAMQFDVTWPNEEPLPPPNPPDATSIYGAFGRIPLSIQQFEGGNPFPLDLCVGTPTYDALTPPVGEFEFRLTLAPPAGGFPDYSSTTGIQYGCVYERYITYPAPAPLPAPQRVIGIEELIFLRGDWTAGRTQ